MSDFIFDATGIAPAADRVLVPKDKYLMQIVKIDLTPVKERPEEKYVAIELDILEGDFAGTKLWDNLSIFSQDEVPARIANARMSAICHSLDILRVTNLADLIGKPLVASVYIKPRETDRSGKEWPEKNAIRTYSKADFGGAAAPRPDMPARPAASPRPATPAAPARRPWAQGQSNQT